MQHLQRRASASIIQTKSEFQKLVELLKEKEKKIQKKWKCKKFFNKFSYSEL